MERGGFGLEQNGGWHDRRNQYKALLLLLQYKTLLLLQQVVVFR